ncbi:MAG: histidine phosphatase family protein [Nocardioides sp.]
MSPLHCPATVLAVAPAAPDGSREAAASLAASDRRQARALGESLVGRRVVLVYSGSSVPAVQTAEIAASVLGVEVLVTDELRERDADEGDDAVVARTTAGLSGIADAHPGETVLLVGDADGLGLTLPRLAVNLRGDHGRERPLGPTGPAELAVDADGWVARSWPGEPPLGGDAG